MILVIIYKVSQKMGTLIGQWLFSKKNDPIKSNTHYLYHNITPW